MEQLAVNIKKIFCLRVWLGFLILPGYLFSQNGSEISRFQMFTNDLVSVAEGTGYEFSNPFRWEKSDWLFLGGTLAGSALLLTVDEDIDHFFKRNRSKNQDNLANFGSNLGKPITVVSLVAAIYSYGIIAKNDWARETAQIFTIALIPGGTIQTISKTVAGRARPYMELGNKHFESFKMEEDYNSFVSGHTLVVTSMALILAERVNNNYLKGLFYSLGLVGAWARMYQRNHFASDVFLGMALGYATVSAATHWMEAKKENKDIGYSWYFAPIGLGINLHF